MLDDFARYTAGFLRTITLVFVVAVMVLVWLVAFPIGLVANLMRPIPAEQAWRETLEIFCPWMEARR